jgi:hypothetical protein
MTFDNLINTYGNSYAVTGSYNSIASKVISACEDLLSSDLKAGGKTFTFAGSHDFNESVSNLSSAFSTNDVVGVAATLSYIFSARQATVEQLTYTTKESEFQDIIVLSALGGYDGNKKLYDELTAFNSINRPVTTNGSKIVLDFTRIRNRCQDYVKDFKINVQGKKIEGEEYEEDILMHGNQVMATETSPEGITYKVEKSGDLPSDANAREEIMAERLQDLDAMVDSGEVVRYSIQEYSSRTVIKTYFKILSDYEKDFNVSNIL